MSLTSYRAAPPRDGIRDQEVRCQGSDCSLILATEIWYLGLIRDRAPGIRLFSDLWRLTADTWDSLLEDLAATDFPVP
jgi:hypothetical protein